MLAGGFANAGSIRPTRRWIAALVVLVTAAGLAFALPSGGSSRPRTVSPRLVGRTDAHAMVHFSLVLRLGQRRLNSFLADLYNPRSRLYHHFIDAKTFGERFGVPAAALQSATRLLSADGVHITAQYPQRTALDARAPAGAVDRLFSTSLMDYVASSGRRFHAPATRPVVPSSLARIVSGISGLDGRYLPLPDDVPNGGLRPGSVGPAYDIAPLYGRGIQGQGEKVGIISFATFPQSDLDGFDQQFGLPPVTPQQASPSDVGPALDTNPTDQGEVLLDLEVVHEVAPEATIIDYNAPYTDASGASTLGTIIDKIVADGQVDIVSDSWGGCELQTSSSDIQRDQQSIEAADARGISIFKSSGDAGAYQCQRANPSDHRLSVEWPTSSPGVIAVGGTSLSVSPSGAYAGETAWEDALSQGGGGGGLSTLFPRPSWQRALGVVNQFSNGKRQLPDVAAAADPNAGWATYEGGQLGEEGGTSAASPFWAGAMTLIEQYARQHGVDHLGFVDPMLYAIASTAQPLPPFRDITIGTNRYYPATTGWDFATGLGSPDVYGLAQDIVGYLKSHRHG